MPADTRHHLQIARAVDFQYAETSDLGGFRIRPVPMLVPTLRDDLIPNCTESPTRRARCRYSSNCPRTTSRVQLTVLRCLMSPGPDLPCEQRCASGWRAGRYAKCGAGG